MISKRYIDHRAFIALLRAAKDSRRREAIRDYFLLYFLGRTGLRISEALALTVGGLSLSTDPPFVSVRTLKRAGGARPLDQVLLEARVVRTARRYVGAGYRAMLDRPAEPADALFPVIKFARREAVPRPLPAISLRNASRIFLTAARSAGLRPGVTLHGLRHYRGTTLYRHTRDLEFVRQQLRHTSIESTRVYLSVPPEAERAYLAKLDRRARRAQG